METSKSSVLSGRHRPQRCRQTSRKAGEAVAHVQAAASGEWPKAIAVGSVRLLNSPSTWKDHGNFTMKPSLSIIAALLCHHGLSCLHAQDRPAKWDVEIPGQIIGGAPSAPLPEAKPIKFKVLNARTTSRNVVEVPEMEGLPPVSGRIRVTVQRVADPGLANPPPRQPVAASARKQAEFAARIDEPREELRTTTLVFISATVYDRRRTLVRILTNGETSNEVTAWSNLDFNHFSDFSSYRVKDGVDGSVFDYFLMMGIGNEETGRFSNFSSEHDLGNTSPQPPKMRDLAKGGPAFIVVEGRAGSPAMNALEQLHDLYRKEGKRMEAAYHASEKARKERKAYLLANPRKPKDVTIRFWKREKSTIEKEGGQP
jgi:hypothetical protein